MSDFEWSDASHARLRVLWDEGHSTVRIAAMMGTTKDAVVGKAHRLGLMPRPSPIRSDGPRQPPKPRTLPKQARTLPPLAAAEPMVATAPAAPPPLRAATQGCQWVTQTGRLAAGIPWLFCDAPVDRPGSAWCAEHRARCYVRVSPLASLSPVERERRMQGLVGLARAARHSRHGSSFGFDVGRVGT
jgi:GcrA cell cycle regulator